MIRRQPKAVLEVFKLLFWDLMIKATLFFILFIGITTIAVFFVEILSFFKNGIWDPLTINGLLKEIGLPLLGEVSGSASVFCVLFVLVSLFVILGTLVLRQWGEELVSKRTLI